MPPKRLRVVESEEKEENPSDDACPPTEQRKARAEEKKRLVLARQRANLKGESMEDSNEEGSSPVAKKEKKEEAVDEMEIGTTSTFDPMRILAQASNRNIVDTGGNFIPLDLDLDSPQLDSDSFQSLSQLSPGLMLSNMSLSSSDSPNGAMEAARTLHEAGEGVGKKKKMDSFADGLDGILAGAVTFVKKGNVKAISRKKGADSLNAPYKRGKSVIGSNILTNVLSKPEDLALLERTYSAPELVLLSSPAFPLDHVHRKAMTAIYKTRLANEQVGVQEAMTINQCLAWLACAARCPIFSLIPQGEYYSDAEDYLRVRLSISKLPLFASVCESDSLKDWTVHQVTRCLQMIALADLRPIGVDDRCILLFAIGVLYIDDAATDEMREAAQSVVRTALSSCGDCSLLLEPLFNLTPLIVRRPDESLKWILMFKGAGVSPPSLLLALGASHFVYVCERAECTPDAFHYASPSATFTCYINVLAETIIDVFAVYNIMPHRRYHRSLVSLLNFVLTPTAINGCEHKSKIALLKCIEVVRNRLNPDLPDDVIVISELRNLTRRVERIERGRGGRRSSQEIIRIDEERAKMAEEKEEGMNGEKKDKEQLDMEREEKEGSEKMEDEEEEEEEYEGEEERRKRIREQEEEEEDMATTDGEKSEGTEDGEGAAKAAFSTGDFMEMDDEVASNASSDLPDTVPDT
ncbi:hypothetical protein PENTCL1PPCAC_11821 [Pristionchus entomophagus]|uniref:Uncharacterized protein n=1 Tax=Pristionchus entomophagus TaxID=358040 RepID=A0AAV5TDH6_9BILA|nr:hypothetical protein PENTCL1PPCAC_11821 [Pristionchus entomophagus]